MVKSLEIKYHGFKIFSQRNVHFCDTATMNFLRLLNENYATWVLHKRMTSKNAKICLELRIWSLLKIDFFLVAILSQMVQYFQHRIKIKNARVFHLITNRPSSK